MYYLNYRNLKQSNFYDWKWLHSNNIQNIGISEIKLTKAITLKDIFKMYLEIYINKLN